MQSYNTLKNIILDLGGVVLTVDFARSHEAFRQMVAGDYEQIYATLQKKGLYRDYETGRIETMTFISELQKVCKTGTTVQQIKDAWNAMILDITAPCAKKIKELKSQYRLFVLSNTNEMHVAKFTRIMEEKHGVTFENAFERIYYSHYIGMYKPELEIYRFVLDDIGISASETLFIDDSAPNIEAAKKTGLHTYHLVPPETLDMLDFSKLTGKAIS